MDDFIDVEEFLEEKRQELNAKIESYRAHLKPVEPEEETWCILDRLFDGKVQSYWKQDAELFPLETYLRFYPIVEKHEEYKHAMRGMMALAAWLGPFSYTLHNKPIPYMLAGYIPYKLSQITAIPEATIWWTLYNMAQQDKEGNTLCGSYLM